MGLQVRYDLEEAEKPALLSAVAAIQTQPQILEVLNSPILLQSEEDAARRDAKEASAVNEHALAA